MENYNLLDLFSGIGGFRLGAEMAGIKFKHEFNSDIDEYANKVYKKNWPESIQLGDITKIKCEDLLKYGKNWIITGGFPCQDISIAGKGAGLAGARSGLWFEMWRIIGGIRPRIAIMENVAALTFRGLPEVLGSLAEIGYNAEWQDIRAEDLGAPHRRERLWIVAYASSDRRTREGEGSKIKKGLQPRSEPAGELAGRLKGCGQEMADTTNARLQGAACGKFGSVQKKVRKSERGGSSGRMPAAGSNWAVEPNVGRVVNGLPNRSHRLRCLGNSIVPQIAELLFRQIAESLEGATDGDPSGDCI